MIRPLRSISNFSRLLRWTREHEVSAFRTHLLWADREPRIILEMWDDREQQVPLGPTDLSVAQSLITIGG